MKLLVVLQFAIVALAFVTSLTMGRQMALAGLLPLHALAYVLILVSVWSTARRVWATAYWLGGPE